MAAHDCFVSSVNHAQIFTFFQCPGKAVDLNSLLRFKFPRCSFSLSLLALFVHIDARRPIFTGMSDSLPLAPRYSLGKLRSYLFRRYFLSSSFEKGKRIFNDSFLSFRSVVRRRHRHIEASTMGELRTRRSKRVLIFESGTESS